MTTSIIMLMFDFCDDVIWPSSLLKEAKELPNFGPWIEAGVSHPSVVLSVERERRKEIVLNMLPKMRKTSG
jgi:hypothetical protein